MGQASNVNLHEARYRQGGADQVNRRGPTTSRPVERSVATELQRAQGATDGMAGAFQHLGFSINETRAAYLEVAHRVAHNKHSGADPRFDTADVRR